MRRQVIFAATIEPAELAALARLRYVSDQEPGLARRRNGKGFVYLNCRGAPLRDPRKIRRIESLVIPPAWRDVWICSVSSGHLQATGRDSRRRKQYLYHERWQHISNLAKFARLAQFGRLLPKVRRKIAAQLAGKELSRQRVLAGMVALLDQTGIRIGNEEYARENDSYGLTTLRDRHVAVASGGVELRFRSKGGLRRIVPIDDKQLARFVQDCAALKGPRLFQCVDDDDVVHSVQSADVNEYLHEISGEPITAKDFRTWKASAQAAGRLFAARAGATKTARKRLARQVVCEAAEMLSNTPTVCRNYYIHPGLLESYEQGTFHEYFDGFAARRQRLFSQDEQVLAQFLSQWRPVEESPRDS